VRSGPLVSGRGRSQRAHGSLAPRKNWDAVRDHDIDGSIRERDLSISPSRNSLSTAASAAFVRVGLAATFMRPSGRIAGPLEIDEVTDWLRSVLADPTSEDARFYVERAYYKLRRYRSPEPRGGR
jgi:hypothetical protein